MSMSLLLMYIPEKRGEVHSEHKLSILSLSSRNRVFPRRPEPAWLPFHFQLCGNRRGEGRASQTYPPSGLWAGLDPSTPGAWRASQALEVNPNVIHHRGGRPLAPRGLVVVLWKGSSCQLQAVCVWKSPGTWWLHPTALMWMCQQPNECSKML